MGRWLSFGPCLARRFALMTLAPFDADHGYRPSSPPTSGATSASEPLRRYAATLW